MCMCLFICIGKKNDQRPGREGEKERERERDRSIDRSIDQIEKTTCTHGVEISDW